MEWASLLAQRLKRVPGMQETWVKSLGQEDPLEKEMATHSVLLPGRFHGRRNLVGYSPRDCKELDTTARLRFSLHMPSRRARPTAAWRTDTHQYTRLSPGLGCAPPALALGGTQTRMSFHPFAHRLWSLPVACPLCAPAQARSRGLQQAHQVQRQLQPAESVPHG